MSYIYVFPIFTILLTIIYKYVTYPYNYWKKQGVVTASGLIPGFGHTLPVLCLRESLSGLCDRLYKSCAPSTSMLGMYHLQTPVLMIRDPELVRTILVKKFSSFHNNLMQVNRQRDWFLSKHPFVATDEIWKASRTRLVSGMSTQKLKVMFESVKRVCDKLDEHLEYMLANDQTEVEVKKFCLKVTGEIVCHAGLGIEDNQRFTKTASDIFECSLRNSTRLILNFFLPSVAAAFGVSFASDEVKTYFKNLVKSISKNQEVIKEEHQEHFLSMVMNEKEDEESIASLVSAFFLDAFESSASVASFTLFRLSQHPGVQKKLRKEIEDTLARHEGIVTYDALKEMTYLEQVINEAIRLHLTLEISVRVCNETTTLRASDGQTCTVEPGHIVIIPAQNLHTDEKYWRNPFAFDPSRFDNDRKNEIIKYAFLPFGEGPRMCPGMRFGMMEVKSLLITILRKCELTVSSKTAVPLEMDPRSFFVVVKGGLWANFQRLQNDKRESFDDEG